MQYCFEKFFNEQPEKLITASGRINLIGEHVDYCGGKVLPASISLKCKVYGKKTDTGVIRIALKGFENIFTLDINALDSYKGLKYANYQAGVAYFLQQSGVTLCGCDLYYDCGVPFGSGLSSSAAIEVATAVSLCVFAGVDYNLIDLALIGQRAENQYAGMNCGIMDQFASAMGKNGQAILLDCNTLEYQYIPLELGDYTLVISNCNKPHNLVESKYNERRAQAESALEKIQTVKDITALAQLSVEEFNEVKHLLDGKVKDRAEHIVNECARVERAVEALKAGDIKTFGEILNQGHYSLRDLYEVTGIELDTLTEVSRMQDGCIGSRMMGGGFGGCTVSVVEKDKVQKFIENVDRLYYERIGYKADFYDVKIVDGVTVTNL